MAVKKASLVVGQYLKVTKKNTWVKTGAIVKVHIITPPKTGEFRDLDNSDIIVLVMNEDQHNPGCGHDHNKNCRKYYMDIAHMSVINSKSLPFGTSAAKDKQPLAPEALGMSGRVVMVRDGIAKWVDPRDTNPCSEIKLTCGSGISIEQPVFTSTLSIKKENTMKFETRHYINGYDINTVAPSTIYDLISQEESAIASLESMATKPKMLIKEIETRKAELARLVEYLDSRETA